MKSARTKACAISDKVKQIVGERDEWKCIICGKPGTPDAHYIPRSDGGLGIEQNVVTLCWDCHREYDNGSCQHMNMRGAYGAMIQSYLRNHYEDWDESKLYYKKYPWSVV